MKWWSCVTHCSSGANSHFASFTAHGHACHCARPWSAPWKFAFNFLSGRLGRLIHFDPWVNSIFHIYFCMTCYHSLSDLPSTKMGFCFDRLCGWSSFLAVQFLNVLKTFHCVVRKTYCTTNSFIELLAPVERIPSSIFCCVGLSSGVFLTCVVSSVGPFLQKLQNCSCRGSIWRAQLGPKGCCKDIWPHTGWTVAQLKKQAMVRSWPYRCSMVRNLTGSKNLLLLRVHSAFRPRTQRLFILAYIFLAAWVYELLGLVRGTKDLQMCVDVLSPICAVLPWSCFESGFSWLCSNLLHSQL